MNLTRIFTLSGLVIVLLSILAAGMRQFWTALGMLAFVVIAGLLLALRNWLR